MKFAPIARLALALAAVEILAGSCGSSSNTPQAPVAQKTQSPSSSSTSEIHISSIDACGLATADALTKVLGAGYQSSGASGMCTYTAANGNTSLLLFGEVLPDKTAADAVQPQQLAASFNPAYGITNAKTLSNIGDKAVEYTISSSGQTGTVIFAFKANVVLMMILVPAPSDTTNVESLAKGAVDAMHA